MNNHLNFFSFSIGQVHYGVLKKDKQRVAIKIQYPGVGKSIESDINNLITLLNFWNIIPRGLYIESVIKVAKRELNWEVDYIREAEWGRRFKNWLINYPMFRIPDIIDNLSTKNVLTTTFFDGITLDNAINEDQTTRDQIGRAILELCLLELFKFKAMQTDPNWSNFLFNQSNKTIALIDFGASRDFSSEFIDNYIQIIRAAADNNPQRIKELSIEGGFLTGYETREMIDAHVNAVMILGEGFRTDKPFDFGAQNTTRSIHKLIPVMLKHRLTPPPEDSYSLHRKMSGAFLLCSKLRSKVYCKPIFERIWQEYKASS
jgi:aarF domain-containing kinase